MTFSIHTVRYITKDQLLRLNKKAGKRGSPTAQPQEVIEGLDDGMYVVQEAKIDSDAEIVRARVLVNIGMIPSLWVEIKLADYMILPSIELPGEDTDFNHLPLEVQSLVGEE